MAIYGGQRNSLASRMSSYGSGADSDNMFGLNEQGQEAMSNFRGSVKDTIKGALDNARNAYGEIASKGHIGKHKGIDILHGAPTMKDVGEGIGTAYTNVRKYFGDRLNSMKKEPAHPTVNKSFTEQAEGNYDTTIKPTALQKIGNAVLGQNTVEYDPQMFYSMKNPNTTIGSFTKEQVPALQQFLKSENLYQGEIDGVAGPQTIKAWNQFTGAG